MLVVLCSILYHIFEKYLENVTDLSFNRNLGVSTSGHPLKDLLECIQLEATLTNLKTLKR